MELDNKLHNGKRWYVRDNVEGAGSYGREAEDFHAHYALSR